MAASSFDTTLGTCVRRARESAGMTQDELGRRLTTEVSTWSQSSIGKVERGARSLVATDLLALAAVLTAGSVDVLVAGVMPEVRRQWKSVGRADRLQRSDQADATIRAARRLGVSVGVLDSLALDAWGRTLLAERERRIGAAPDDPAEARRLATRALLQELRSKLVTP